jgi:hypothetical protein
MNALNLNWLDIVSLILVVAYVATWIYGWRHRHEPFWSGFVNPFK